MKRFINADVLLSTGTGFLGFNMFAYCNNNPVMGYDPSGCVVTEWDENNLTRAELDDLKTYTDLWENGSYNTRKDAHLLATLLREPYLENDQYVMHNGHIGRGTFDFNRQFTGRSSISYSMTRTQIIIDVSQANMDLCISVIGYEGLALYMINDYIETFGHPLFGRTIKGLADEIDAHERLYKKHLKDDSDEFTINRYKIANLEGSQYKGDKNYYYSEYVPFFPWLAEKFK